MPGTEIELGISQFDVQAPPEDDRVFIEFRRLPGSDQPDGLFMRAMLTAVVPEFTRPMNSSISFGGCPAASMVVGFWI